MSFKRQLGVPLATLAILLAINLASAHPIDLNLAYFVGDHHPMSQWLVKWANDLERESGGRITVKRFPGSQMGPVQQHYDFVRTGQADVAWFLPRGNARTLPADRDRAGAVPRRQRGDRHQGAQRSRAEVEVYQRRASGRESAAAFDASAGQRAHHEEADPHHRRHERAALAVRVAHDPRLHRGSRRNTGWPGAALVLGAVASRHV